MDWWQPTILVDVKRDSLDVVSLLINVILGSVAVYSLWLSRKALKKSEWDSAMSTSPSIVIRPSTIQVWTKTSKEGFSYSVHPDQNLIRENSEYSEIAFVIKFECFNAGRGVAFNISQPKTKGFSLHDFYDNKTPLYLTKEDSSVIVNVWYKDTFAKFYEIADIEIPVSIVLTYTNDQNNIFCRSTWSANVKPFDKDGNDLKPREIRLLKRNGKIEYSETAYEN